MPKDLPYKAEYAKSGRAGCKACKSTIAQSSLRLARMVQSPHFDGKMPMWYHFACFFMKFHPNSTKDIEKFDDLRWDDQEKIREKMPSGSTGAVKDEADGPSIVKSEFEIEYAKSGRAKCRKCDDKIEKGVIRVSKQTEVQDEENFRTYMVPHWYHVDCFVLKRNKLEATDLGANQIPGFNALSEEDQQLMIQKIGYTEKPKAKPKKKGKSKKNVPDEKPSKGNSALETKLKQQNKKYWEVRDELYRNCSNKYLKELLEFNDYYSAGGESELLDRCTDGMMFGALDPCPECKNGRLTYSADGYKCTGHISGWTPCLYTTLTPARREWKIPEEFKEESAFFSSFKAKIKERLFPEAAKEAFEKGTQKEEEGSLPLQGKKIVIVGKLKQTKVTIKAQIEDLGGSLSDTVTKNCFCCISSPGEVTKLGKKMQIVEKNNVPVVTEDYIDAIKKGGAKLMLTQYAIAPWGGDRNMDEVDGKEKSTRKRKTETSSKSGEKKAKMTMKGGAVVDPDSGMEDCCHVLTSHGEIYAAVLGLVDLTRGTNSYYKLQILEHDHQKHCYYVFRSWGRVGTTIGGNKLEEFDNREDAIWNFNEVFEEKTGNTWQNRKNFQKYPNRFYPIDIDYGQDDEAVQSSIKAGSISKLSQPVQDLMKLIFDVEAMKHALVEFEIDLKKMPLGKLSKKQIETAYKCLTECQQLILDGITSGSKVLDASNRFFTLIPHDFGMSKPPLIDNQELLTSKIQMLDSLLEIEIAYSLMKVSKGDEEKDPLDVHYESLKANIHEIGKGSEEFKMICEYVKNTHAKTHSSYSLEVSEVFKVEREGEKKRFRAFKDLHNRRLLWHGSRVTNFAGILSQGLRIAPPEAPVTGYMFGKGVYFADMVSKSANYCYASHSSNTGLMLLCDVALGNCYELTAAKHIKKLPAGKHSCKGMGGTAPDSQFDKTLPDGLIVPLGNGKKTDVTNTSLLYNEYIVYDTAQINMKYLIKLKFKYKY